MQRTTTLAFLDEHLPCDDEAARLARDNDLLGALPWSAGISHTTAALKVLYDALSADQRKELHGIVVESVSGMGAFRTPSTSAPPTSTSCCHFFEKRQYYFVSSLPWIPKYAQLQEDTRIVKPCPP